MELIKRYLNHAVSYASRFKVSRSVNSVRAPKALSWDARLRLEKLEARAQRGVPVVRIYEEVKRCDQQQEMLFRWIERVANHLQTELFERLNQDQSLNPQDSQFIQHLSRLVPTEFRHQYALLEVLKTEDIRGE